MIENERRLVTVSAFGPDGGKPTELTCFDMATGKSAGPGPIRTLRVSAFSTDFIPLSGSGTLFELKITRVNEAAQSTPLLWAAPGQFIFIDAELNAQAPGTVTAGTR